MSNRLFQKVEQEFAIKLRNYEDSAHWREEMLDNQ